MSETQTIEQRLNTLPQKIAMPFRQLLSAGQLNEDNLSIILDAGELSGDYTKLIGFAIGFLHLRSQRVPVHDVIAMAKLQKRRVNLTWSAKRWELEHQRLSRAETLERLAKENVHYDLSDYDDLLPEKFHGYLIRTSRRLGMEGLRQRHCIASYHDRIKSGRCAIASIFAEKKRWTVELIKTDNQDAPLRINQIKSRYNEIPTQNIREAIFKTLSIDSEKAKPKNIATRESNYTYLETLQRILPILRDHQIQNVNVYFSGYGDSGQIDNISYNPQPDIDPGEITVQHFISSNHFEDGQWINTRQLEETSLNEAIDELTYNYLDETDIDWYNNDGGSGDLVINVTAGTVSLEVNVNHVETTTEYHSERNIFTGEEV